MAPFVPTVGSITGEEVVFPTLLPKLSCHSFAPVSALKAQRLAGPALPPLVPVLTIRILVGFPEMLTPAMISGMACTPLARESVKSLPNVVGDACGRAGVSLVSWLVD